MRLTQKKLIVIFVCFFACFFFHRRILAFTLQDWNIGTRKQIYKFVSPQKANSGLEKNAFFLAEKKE